MKIKGNTIVSTPIILILSLSIFICIFVTTINCIMPYIVYEKIQCLANKYMFVLEEWGYLPVVEKNKLIQELVSAGLQKQNIYIQNTNTPKSYGELIFLEIRYSYNLETISWINTIMINSNGIDMIIKKTSFSKK